MTPVAPITTNDIRSAIRAHFPSGAHAVIEEVRNGTGYGQRIRSADAVVVSCWPSRGLWIAGIEIKISRQDWNNELKNPAKAAEIYQWCDYWWLAAPTGLVKGGELPATWGLLEYDPAARSKDKLVVLKPAPKLEPAPLTAAFAASVARSLSKSQDNVTRIAVAEAESRIRDELGAHAVEELRQKLMEAERACDHYKMLEEKSRETAEELRLLKLELNLRWNETAAEAGKMIKASKEFRELRLGEIAKRLRYAAEAVELAMVASPPETAEPS